jgi:very-short-patch-repair endonuclease
MRLARRWTHEDLQALTQRQYGLVSVPPPPLSAEARLMRLAKIRAVRRKLEAVFEQHLTWTGMRSAFDTQVLFHAQRKWKLDYFARAYQLAVELHGGTHSEGRHVRGEGFHNDREKINAAIELGITVLEFTGAMLEDGTAISQTERMLKARGWKREVA